MASDLKILGQTGDASTEVDLYTVPSAHQTIISTITVCNRGATERTFDVIVSPGGGATANEDYIYKSHPIAGNRSFAATFGITLDATDVLRVLASHSDLTFIVFGDEVG